jgi:hypothetical protein
VLIVAMCSKHRSSIRWPVKAFSSHQFDERGKLDEIGFRPGPRYSEKQETPTGNVKLLFVMRSAILLLITS